MANVCFYLGAGASCQALPLVKQIPDRLQQAIEFLQRNEHHLVHQIVKDYPGSNVSMQERYTSLIDDLRWLKEQSAKHATIDTFAKKLHIKGERMLLIKLKSALIAFFTIEQFESLKIDSRYDAFFSSILESSHFIPENIRIISWNYDLQLEMALAEYSDSNKISINSSYLRSVSKNIPIDKMVTFKYFKINGVSDYRTKLKEKVFHGGKITSDADLLNLVVNCHFNAIRQDYFPLISFAWEKEYLTDDFCINVVDAAITSISDCDILVVIGYSFPFFNREVDRKIISGMNLKKVYIQDMNAEAIIDRFQAINTTIERRNIVAIQNDMDQFFIPHEM